MEVFKDREVLKDTMKEIGEVPTEEREINHEGEKADERDCDPPLQFFVCLGNWCDLLFTFQAVLLPF